ncbi:MAG: hypothetical protein K0R09_1077 [Clostridiales bacterium]|jgi:hypothetical protein|nr:hypothetical protein [Clostridiales bacterium]
MKQRKRVEWTRLDNASKFFPATCNEKDTKVFRFSCELYEVVEPEVLQQALNTTIEAFPLYKSVLRRGVFWYYLEKSDISPTVEIEANPVCAPIYIRDKRNLLFRVFYYNNRISVEIFHTLSDGTGALWFMQTLVHHYLVLKYKETFEDNTPKLNYNASLSEKMDDSFGRYFLGENKLKGKFRKDKREKASKSYHIRGTRLEENRMKLIEGSMSVKAILELAHKYNTTLTIFITALFLYSIYKEMSTYVKNRPVVLSVPINLRQFFASVTARNFFSTMNVGYHFGKGSKDFKEVIQRVKECFEKEVNEESVNKQFNPLVSLEKNPFARIIPLPFKDYSLRIANKLKDRGITAALSNVGKISMPKEFDAYIRQFFVCTSARRPQLCICSYRDRLAVSFTSPFLETEIQRTFFQFLSNEGIEIEISSNI